MNALPRLHLTASPWVAEVLTHLWQSTVVALGILLLLAVCHRLSARTRRTLGWIALVKFALPAAWFVQNAKGFTGAPKAWLATDTLLLPGSVSRGAMLVEAPAATWAAPAWLWPILAVVWGLGATFLIGRWVARGMRVRRQLLVGARPVSATIADNVAYAAASAGLRTTPRCFEVESDRGPGAVGIVSPVLILPRGLAEGLSAAEREAILIHECVHLQRRDNLWSAVRAGFVGLLWFNPIAWLLNRAIAIETEKSCDERVLELTGDAESYARSIVASVRHTLGLAQPGFAAATTPPVVARLKNILAYPARPDRPAARWAAVVVALGLVALGGRAGSIAATAPAVQKKSETAGAPEDSKAAELGLNLTAALKFLREQTERLKREAATAQQRLSDFKAAGSTEADADVIRKSLELEAATKAQQHAELLKRLKDVEKAQSMWSRRTVRVAQASPAPIAEQPAPTAPAQLAYKIGTIRIKPVGLRVPPPGSRPDQVITLRSIRSHLQSREGGEFNEKTIDRDVRALYALGLFKTVEVKHEPVDEKTFNLVFELTPKPAPVTGALDEETDSKSSLVAVPPAPAVSPLGDREILERLAAQISPTGIMEIAGKRQLFIYGRRFEVGARIAATLNNQDYEVELTALERTSYTLRYRGDEIVRPIAASTRTFNVGEGKLLFNGASQPAAGTLDLTSPPAPPGSTTSLVNLNQGTLTLSGGAGPNTGVTFDVPAQIPSSGTAQVVHRTVQEELNDAQQKLAEANAELKRLRDERAAALAREKEIADAQAREAASQIPRATTPSTSPAHSTVAPEKLAFRPPLISTVAASVPRIETPAVHRGMKVFDISELDQGPVARFQARPQYPFEMRRAGIGGEVVVDFIVDTDGQVQLAQAIRSSRVEFEAAAVQAVSKWKFNPGQKGGRDVPTHMQVPIVFTLEKN